LKISFEKNYEYNYIDIKKLWKLICKQVSYYINFFNRINRKNKYINEQILKILKHYEEKLICNNIIKIKKKLV